MKDYFACLGLVIGTFLYSSFLFAQTCLTVKPAPACRSCFITELGYSYKITPPLKGTSIKMVGDSVVRVNEWEVTGRHYLISELGYIYNLNAKYGLGFTLFNGWDIGYNWRGGMKLRMRKWLNQKISLDLSAGAILWSESSELKRPAFIGGANLNCNWNVVNVLVEVFETESFDYSYFSNGLQYRNISPRRRNVGVYLGYKLSSMPGLVFNALAAVTTGVVLIMIITSIEN